MERIARTRYPKHYALRQVHGVGPLTALQFVLRVGNPHQIRKSRDLGPHVLVVPKKRQSGETGKQMRISKAVSPRLRSLLVQCSQFVLGRFGPDSDLKRWNLAFASADGKRQTSRNRRSHKKLAVLLHKLWLSGAPYQPLYNTSVLSTT
jgi:transposase